LRRHPEFCVVILNGVKDPCICFVLPAEHALASASPLKISL
jgi:hypothetical protein